MKRCTICVHPQRAEIEKALLGGRPAVHIAREFSVGRDALRRHAAAHLARSGPATRPDIRAHDQDRAVDNRKILEALRNRALNWMQQAERDRDYVLAMRASREAIRALTLMLRLDGELDQAPAVAVNVESAAQQQIIVYLPANGREAPGQVVSHEEMLSISESGAR